MLEDCRQIMKEMTSDYACLMDLELDEKREEICADVEYYTGLVYEILKTAMKHCKTAKECVSQLEGSLDDYDD